ncbi:MAG: sacsin N-terminal ATP-binding-like domain-containing protein, partial [Candidatus Helarchaeota archaeon]
MDKSTPKDVIEEIRKTRFMLGLYTEDLTEDVKKILEDKKVFVKNAARLVREINTVAPRFIFELIQNADDNKYESTVKPKIKFILHRDYLLVQNNERGFSDDDVWALCGIGESKKKKSLGYIGEKGIGFNSVYMVTNEPHIYSNGFQFRFKFDEKSPESVIIPEWVDNIPDFIDLQQTNIFLPIKPEKKTEIKDFFDEVHPNILLFLRKLKEIKILLKEKNKTVVKKIELNEKGSIIEIVNNGMKNYWKIIKKLFKIPQTINEKRRENIIETEIILAFPLNKINLPETSNKQYVFAFLPIKKYGFKFVIQADFILSINREDIIKDNDWNKWLRDSIIEVYLDAVEEFKKSEKMKYTFHNYLPLDEIDDDFFLPVVNGLYSKLREKDCILTETNRWCKPSEVFFTDKEIKKVISNEEVKRNFGKEYISRKMKVKKLILQKLGVKNFSIDNLFTCLENDDWVKNRNAKWFADLFKYLSNKKLSYNQLEKLRELNIIKLENNELTAINAGIIFFPLKHKNYGFEKELRILKRGIFDNISKFGKEDRENVQNLLEDLGLKTPNAYEIIENHIIPFYEQIGYNQIDVNTHIGHIKFIKDNIDEYERIDQKISNDIRFWSFNKEDLSKKRLKNLPILLARDYYGNERYLEPEKIYLSKMYGNNNNLEILFEGINIYFIHPCYIESSLEKIDEKIKALQKRHKNKGKKRNGVYKNDNMDKVREKIELLKRDKKDKIKGWKDFFLSIGVNVGLRIIQIKNSYLRWQDKQKLRSGGSYTAEKIIDYSIEFLNPIINNPHKDKIRILIKLLDNQWPELSKKKTLIYKWRYYSWKENEKADSTWIHLLKTTSWVPTSFNNFKKPSEVFLNISEIQEFLGESVPYITVKIKNVDLIWTLNINRQANVDNVINYLKILVEEESQEKERFKKLYEFLELHFVGNENKIKTIFTSKPLIFVPDSKEKYYR